MRTARLAVLVFLPFLAFSACIIAIGPGATKGVHSSWGWSGRSGSGVSATQTRLAEPFHALRIEGCCNASVSIGTNQSVGITADDNLIDDITTEVKDGVLVISMKDGTNDSFHVGPKASIVVAALDIVSIQGSGDVDVQGLNCESFTAQIEGSGDLRVLGSATKLKAGIEGSGDMDLSGLETQDASVSIEGSGDVRVRCSATLAASVSGSGDIDYSGSPSKTNISVSGSGNVRPVH